MGSEETFWRVERGAAVQGRRRPAWRITMEDEEKLGKARRVEICSGRVESEVWGGTRRVREFLRGAIGVRMILTLLSMAVKMKMAKEVETEFYIEWVRVVFNRLFSSEITFNFRIGEARTTFIVDIGR